LLLRVNEDAIFSSNVLVCFRLVAAMRCFAQEKLGFNVELQAEIELPPTRDPWMSRSIGLKMNDIRSRKVEFSRK
jgi:hypothetical protein